MRYLFGGSPADYAMERVGNQLLVRPGAVGTVWDALTGGTQITDLTNLTGAPIIEVTADADGAVTFMGPDGVTSLFVDFGYARRFALTAVTVGSVLTEFMAQGGEPGGWAQLDGSGNIDSSQIPAQLDWIVVRSYGAVGDGTTDDTIAIQTAINACPVGGIVYFPRGVYRTSATLDWKNGVTLLGSHANLMTGPGMTGAEYPCYIQPTMPFTGTSVLQIIGEDDGEHPAISGEQRMVNLMLDGSQLTGNSIDGIFAKGNVQNVIMENVCIRQMPNNGMVTGDVAGVWPYSWRLRHIMVDNCHANGILFTGNTDLTLDDVQVIGSWGQGIVLTNITNGQLLGCRTEWNGSHGYRITGPWGDWQGSGGMQMTGCSTDRNGGHGVFIDATGNTPISISNLMTRRDGRNGGTGGGGYAGLAVIGATVPVTIDGVTCYPGVDDGGTSTNSPQYGVRLSGSSSVMLDTAYLHAQTAGLLEDGTNTVVSLGPSIMTVVGPTTAAVRVRRPATAPVVTLTDAATIATDASRGAHFKVSMAGNRTLGVPTNPVDGQRAVWEVTATGGARALALAGGAGGFVFGSDITGLTATASTKTDFIGAVYSATANAWRVIAYVKGY
ncbi:right-handed parallel beta-helix repeat-containing protein [Streptomyces sp. M2CJ-2]|uniref:right-handed parallel beta-helix repeat-containing protein n=1 Tax=Streptomyces sp. M2CJ-2 TaxID=2803948 RepID=UPI001922A459|nr:right-handed parallel beta-helix repeat-containing protein [Streptomyces sp. M2CJ-2]MBL3664540.1 right-handed parallel beta-helix repeat-containing protein [Streptomyces sp. M2CJ-2]